MNEIKVEIVADSINQQGDRLTSLVLTYPRIIHSEMMTHRMFSRNASSSRAVPIQKMIEAVKNNTFCPFEFQKAHKGMQGSEYFTGQDKEDCIKLWLESAELALQQAEKMKEKGITKQVINRILEPYQYYTMLITGSKEGWDNFFELRCPQYRFSPDDKLFKSKKEFIEYEKIYNGHSTRKIEENQMDWLYINEGQAEIHMMALAEEIYDAVNASTPKLLQPGEWHIPFLDEIDFAGLGEASAQYYMDNPTEIVNPNKWTIKASTALAAWTSYTVVGVDKKHNYAKMFELHDSLLVQDPQHASPMEHIGKCMTDEEHNTYIKGIIDLIDVEEPQYNGGIYEPDESSKGWCRNFKGFIPYRHIIETGQNI